METLYNVRQLGIKNLSKKITKETTKQTGNLFFLKNYYLYFKLCILWKKLIKKMIHYY